MILLTKFLANEIMRVISSASSETEKIYRAKQ